MKVGLLYNAKPDGVEHPAPDDADEEYDHPATISAIRDALCGLGLTVVPMEADRRMPGRLEEEGCDFVFNVAEGRGRRCREAVVPALCELLELPYTGSDALTMAATLDKFVARRLVSPEVPVARAVLLDGEESEGELERLCYPAIVKPNDEGSSKGIRENAVVESAAEARERARGLREAYGCPVLVRSSCPASKSPLASWATVHRSRCWASWRLRRWMPIRDSCTPSKSNGTGAGGWVTTCLRASHRKR